MHYNKVIKDGKVNKVVNESVVDGVQYIDEKPIEGSLNPVTSGGVKEAISEAVADIPSIEAAIPEGAGEEDQLVKSSELNTVDGRLESVESKIPSSASSTDKLVTKSELENATASMESGYTPKGPASVSTLNGLTGQENGDQYIVTDSGTLTDGSLAVTAGESVAWDSVSEVWYKVNQYALKSVQVNITENFAPAFDSTLDYFINDICTYEGTLYIFTSDHPAGAWNPVHVLVKEQSALLQMTAQNALAGNIAEEFDKTRTSENPYKVGATVCYHGKLFVFKAEHYGDWTPADVIPLDIVGTLCNVGRVSATEAASAPYNDLDTFPLNETCIVAESEAYSIISNKPTDEAFNVLTFGGTNGAKCQIVSTVTKRMFMRSSWSGSWSDWLEVGTDKIALHNIGQVSGEMAATSPYNDLNTFPINEVAIAIASYSAIDHKPTDESFNVLTFGGTNGGKCQVASTITKKMFMRSCWGGNWSAWVEISGTDQAALHNIGRITTTTASTSPYNDLDTFPINEVSIAIDSYSLIAHKPTNESFNVLTFGGTNGGKCQIASTITKKMYMRSCWAGTWSDWVEIAIKEETFVDVLNQFDNILCVGDSLTWSQVYTGASTSRQAKKTYPTVLGEITHATVQGLAYPGDNTVDAWTRWKDTFEAKTNALAIVYLGTNGGLTDTLETDCPSDTPYTSWVDTNTGCYGKIIAKLKELGYKIVLIQPWAVGSSADLATTQGVVTEAGTRFGCAVVKAFKTTELKYHYYPDGSGSNGLHYNDFGYSWFAYTLCSKVNNLDNDNLKLIIPS